MIDDYQLFLGFLLTEPFLAQFNLVSSDLKSVFIHPQYLQLIQLEGQTYLGKYLGARVEYPALELMQANIYSLLRRLIYDYPYEQFSLVLLAVKS